MRENRCRAVLGSMALAALLVACGSHTSTAGRSSSSTFQVVPVTGSVAGGGYGFWLQKFWQLNFGQPTVPLCSTATGPDGQTIGFLNDPQPGTHSVTCTEPAGRSLYVTVTSVEVSTFAGNHGQCGPDHGMTALTSDAQLPLCVRQMWPGTTVSATVDGRTVPVSTLLAASPVFPIEVVAGNDVGFNEQGHGRAAAYGSGMLLTGLSAGTHVIHVDAAYPPQHLVWDDTFTVNQA